MMKKTTLVAVALTTVFATSSAFAWWGDSPRGEHSGKREGCKSERHEHRGKGMRGAKIKEHMDRELTAEEVRTLQEARLIYQNNPNIKIGEVTSTNTGYKVTIVTKDNSLVEVLDVAKNGMQLERFEAIQKRLESRQSEQKK